MTKYGLIGSIQKNDPPCPSKDKPCDIHHKDTIEKGLFCPCKCHYTKENNEKMKKKFDRIINIDNIWPKVDY